MHRSRQSFATHFLEAGYYIRTVQELLGLGISTLIYTYVLNRRGRQYEVRLRSVRGRTQK